MKLSEQELVDLRWMKRVNDTGTGLFGPSVRKGGPVPTCERLISLGLAETHGWGANGYWITPAGRALLNEKE